MKIKNDRIGIMNIVKKIYIASLVFFYINSTNAGSFCLKFSSDFLSLLRCQEKCYLLEFSKKIIDQEIQKLKSPGEYLINAMCYYSISQNLGEESVLGEMAYIYTQAQDRSIIFDESCCDKILKVLDKYLKKTFSEYENIIFYYNLSPKLLQTKEEEYNACKSFMEFFRGYEDEPLKRLGNIFKEIVRNVCTIQ